MESRTGFVTRGGKPQIAPKPKVLPTITPTLHAVAIKYISNLDVSESQRSITRPVPKPRLLKNHHLQSKPVVSNGEHNQERVERTSENQLPVGLLNSKNGLQHNKGFNVGSPPATASFNNIPVFSINQKREVRETYAWSQSPAPNRFLKPQSKSETGYDSQSTNTGLSPKSPPVLIKHQLSGLSAYELNGLGSAQKPRPVPLPNTPTSIGARQENQSDLNLRHLEIPVYPKNKVLTVKERTLLLQQNGFGAIGPKIRPAIAKTFPPQVDNKPNNEDTLVLSPNKSALSLQQKPIPDIPANKSPEKNIGTNLKPKVQSFSSEDKYQNNVQNVINDLDLSVEEMPMFPSKGQIHNFTALNDEQSVDIDSKASKKHYRTFTEVKKYKCHLVDFEEEFLFSIEQSVDGEVVENEPIYETISDEETVSETQNQPPIISWKRHLINNEEFAYKRANGFEDFTNVRVQPNYTDSHIYEEISSMLTNPEKEFYNISEDEEDQNVTTDKGDPRKTKLAHIAKEIMTSEKVFVDVLKLLHITFRNAVTKASHQAGKPVIEERHLNQILLSLPQLYELNCNLLKELQKRISNWKENPAIADIFVKNGPYLKLYSGYICDFDKNVALLEEQCRKNPAFAKVVQEFESSPCCANLAVKHYMLKPVQRLPQYQLLLTDYLKNLDEDSPEYERAQDALCIVKEVANHANETLKQEDQFQKLIQVQCRLIGNQEIVKPGRVLLKDGILLKLSSKVMQPQMFFLFNDALMYAKLLQTGQYKLNKELSLSGLKVSKPFQEAYQNELNIESVQHSFILSASTPAVRDSWLEAISNAIEEYAKKMTSFTKSPEEGDRDSLDGSAQLGTKAPIWIPDQRATMCMICTCEFTLTYRRHHCRACGKVICQACSSNNYPLEYLKNQPARVCDQCFEILQQNCSRNQAPAVILSPYKTLNRRHKKIPSALKEVSANTFESSMSGYMERMKGNKKQWKRFWFVIKNKVLYTYAASEDVAALESLPLLGFSLKEIQSESTFSLYHKDTLFYTFKTEDPSIFQRWIKAFHEAMTL